MLFYQKTTLLERRPLSWRNVVWAVKTAVQAQKDHIYIPNLTELGENADMAVKPFDKEKAVLV